jgi:tetratricopeptide (TPR) repeat protein
MNDADAFHARGFNHRKRGDFRSAIADYTRAIELDPSHFKGEGVESRVDVSMCGNKGI